MPIFNYLSCLHKLEAKDGRNLATFYLMNTSRNRNRWGVSDKALIEALPTIAKAPLGLDSQYKGINHPRNPIDVGNFVSFEKPNGYCTATAEIQDQKVWELLQHRKLGPISVVVTPYHASCSKCGAPIRNQNEIQSHNCIMAGDAYAVVDSFKFDRVDFVDNPAYPQAGILKMGAADTGIINPIKLCAGVYESQFQKHSAFGSGGTNPKNITREGKKLEKTIEQLQAELDKKQETIDELKAKAEKTSTTLEEIKKKLEAKKAEPTEAERKLEILQAELKQIKDAKHAELLSAAVDKRFEAGLIKEKEDERKRIADFGDDVLKMLASDAQAVSNRIQAAAPPGPKTKYVAGADGFDDFSKAVLKARADRGFTPIKKESA